MHRQVADTGAILVLLLALAACGSDSEGADRSSPGPSGTAASMPPTSSATATDGPSGRATGSMSTKPGPRTPSLRGPAPRGPSPRPPKPETAVVVPHVVDRPWPEAAAMLRPAGLKVSLLYEDGSGMCANDEEAPIVRQDPAAGEKVSPGTTVRLTASRISGGHAWVPSLVNWTMGQSLKRLGTAGLFGIVQDRSHVDDYVIDQAPPACARVPHGSGVRIYTYEEP